MNTGFIGVGADPLLFMWFMRWIPFAIGHGFNPLYSNFVSYPYGVNILWNTSIPLASICLWPVTHLFGVVVAYNVLIIGSMVAACLAMFMFCDLFFGNKIVAVVCGAVYGFSPYMVAESLGHPHLTSTSFCIPIIGIISLKFLRGQDFSKRQTLLYGLSLGIVSLAELLLGEEVYATTWLVGALTLAVLMVIKPIPKTSLHALLRLAGTAGLFSVILSSPLIAYQILGPAKPAGALQPFNVYVADAFNLFVPGPFRWIKDSATLSISSRFTGNGSEWTSYIGIPFILIILIVSIRLWERKSIRVISVMMVLVVLLSFGPELHLDGYVTNIRLPWDLIERLPLLDSALPSRLSVYSFVFLSLFLGFFMTEFICGRAHKNLSRLFSIGVLILGLAVFSPQVGSYPTSRLPKTPAIFVNGGLDSVLPRHKTALVIPFSDGGHASAMYWQQESEFYFKMPEGYVVDSFGFGPAPSVLQSYVSSLESGASYRQPTTNQLDQMRGYLRFFNVYSVLLVPSPNKGRIERLIDDVIGTGPTILDGAYTWRVPHDLHGYYISGQYWYTTGEFNWIGKTSRVVSYGIPVEVTLSGMWRPVSQPVRITAFLGNGVKESYEVAQASKVMFTVGANTDVSLRAGKTFIPNDYLHNGDERHLSVLIHVDAGA